MSETRWRVTLDNRASRGAVKLTRELRAMAEAMREVKEAAAGLGGLGGLGGGRRSGGGSGSGGGGGLDRVRRAHRDSIRDVGRAQKAQGREDARQWGSALRSQRAQVRLFRQRDAAAGRSARAEERAQAARARAMRQEARERREAVAAGLGGAAATLGGIVAATTAAAAAILGIVTAVGSLVFRLSEAVLEMIAFREASIATLGLMSGAGSAQERQRVGAEEFGWARQFARETPLDVRDVIGLRTQAATAGFQGTRARDVVMASADVGAASPTNPMAAQRFMTAIGQILSKGRLQTEELNQLTEAGVSRDAVFAEIARARGMRGTDQENNNRVADLIRRGQITGEQGNAAVLAAVRQRSGGELGGLARAGGSTLMGTLSNLRGAFADFVLGVEGIENLPGIVALKKTLNGIVDLLTGTGPTAVRLRTIFAGIVNEAAMFVATIGGKGGIDGIVSRALDLFEEWYPVVRDVLGAFASSAWSTFVEEMGPMLDVFGQVGQDREGAVQFAREFGKALATIFAFGVRTTIALAAMIPVVTMLVDKFLKLAETLLSLPNISAITTAASAGPLAPLMLGGAYLRERFAGIGAEIPEGMREGVEANRGGLMATIAALNADMEASTRADLAIQSPSRVFAELGSMVSAGMALGVDSGARDVERAMGGMVAPQGLPGFGGDVQAGRMLGFGGGTFTFSVTVQSGGGAEIGEAIATQAFELFVGKMERSALAAGE